MNQTVFNNLATPQPSVPRCNRRSAKPVLLFALVAAAHLGFLLAVVMWILPEVLGLARFAPIGVFLAVTSVTGLALCRDYPHVALGLCNTVTYFRATLVCLLAVPLFAPAALADPAFAWATLALAAFALALDGVDGWLARRSGLVSAFGARFDVETDALLALILALLAWQAGKVGAWVLMLGVLRYGFVGLGLVLPFLRAPLPERFRRKAVCVVQLTALIVLLAPPLTASLSQGLAAVALALLLWSFAADGVWLWRRRGLA